MVKIAEAFSISVIGDMGSFACISSPIKQIYPFDDIQWTNKNLSTYSKTVLSILAKTEYLEINENGHTLFIVHGSPKDYLSGSIYPNDSKQKKNRFLQMIGENDYLVTGHTHIPMYYKNRRGKVIINPGSVGQPCNNDPRASAVVLELEKGSAIKINWIKTTYDIDQVIERVKQVAIPRNYCERLRRGVSMKSARAENLFFGQ